MGIWGDEIKADKAKVAELFSRAPKPESNYHRMSEKELESELIAVHKLQGEMQSFQDKYLEAIRSDDELSKQIREDDRVWHPPRT
jgi:hypothetical protein